MTEKLKLRRCFVAVHAGAGFHAKEREQAYKDLCKKACQKAVGGMKAGCLAHDAAVITVKELENSPLTNAGVGSNLTLDGTVECDASIMDGNSLMWGAVGAVSDIKNPIEIASAIANKQKMGITSLGRVPPCLLVGEGAVEWAVQEGFERCDLSLLMTESSQKTYRKNKRKLQKEESETQDNLINDFYKDVTSQNIKTAHNLTGLSEESTKCLPQTMNVFKQSFTSNDNICGGSDVKIEAKYCKLDSGSSGMSRDKKKTFVDNRKKVDQKVRVQKDEQKKTFDKRSKKPMLVCEDSDISSEEVNVSELLDTVGCICIDYNGNVVSAVSSGGISLKQRGRIGQAAMYGCGCWAENATDSLPGVAVSTTGCGEQIIKALLAKQCADCIKNYENATLGLSKAFKDVFLGSKFLQSVSKKYAGVLAIRLEDTGDAELVWVHSTDSMCIGYMSSEDKHAKAVISRLPPDSVAGNSVSMQGQMHRL